MATRTVTRTRKTDRPEQEPREVVSRELLGEGFHFSIKHPGKGRWMQTPNGVSYVQFGRPVVGGFVNFHIFGKPVMRGKRIRVEGKVFKKTLEDGSEYLYVDLYPSEAERLSHEIKVYQNVTEAPEQDGMTLFPCVGDIMGAVGFVLIDHEARAAEHADAQA